MAQQKQGLVGRRAQRKTKRYASGGTVDNTDASTYPYTGQPAQDSYAGAGRLSNGPGAGANTSGYGAVTGAAPATGALNTSFQSGYGQGVGARPAGEQGNGGDAAAIAAGQQNIRNAGGGNYYTEQQKANAAGPESAFQRWTKPTGATQVGAAFGFSGGTRATPEQLGEQGNGGDAAAIAAGQQNIRNAGGLSSAQADRELSATGLPTGGSYQNVGNVGNARYDAERGQLSFTDKNFDPTKQKFGDGTGAITGANGHTVVYTGMGVPTPQAGTQGPKAAGDVRGMAQQLADMSSQRMNTGYGPSSTPWGNGTSGGGVGTNAVGVEPYRFSGPSLREQSGRVTGLVPSSQRHAEAAMYAANVGRDSHLQGIGMQNQAHLQGIGMQGQNQLAGIGLQGQNQLAGIGMQGQNQLAGIGMQGQNQLQNTQLGHNLQTQGALQLEQYKANTPQALGNAAYTQQNARLAGAQTDQARANLRNENSAQGQIQKSADIILRGSLNSGNPMTPEEAFALARSEYEKNKPPSAEDMNALAAAFLAQKAGKPKQGYADGGQVETAEQLMARMAAKYGASAPTPAPPPAPPLPRPQPAPTPYPSSGGLLGRTVDSANSRSNTLKQISSYAHGGPVSVGGRQVMDPSGRMDYEGTDSLPAVIDGDPAQPAALTSGEFVFPVDVVQHFGTARLKKMIEDARKGAAHSAGHEAA